MPGHVHCVEYFHFSQALALRLTAVGIYVKMREVTAGDIQSQPVPLGKSVAGRERFDPNVYAFPWRHQ